MKNKPIDFFKDKHGKIVIAQRPNSPLIGFLLSWLLSIFWPQQQQQIIFLLNMLTFGFIFTWAWLEISDGVNYFRRLLGVIVLVFVLWSRVHVGHV